jgi:hypothetical protein
VWFHSGMVALVAELEGLVSRWQALVESTNTAEDAGFIKTTQGIGCWFLFWFGGAVVTRVSARSPP